MNHFTTLNGTGTQEINKESELKQARWLLLLANWKVSEQDSEIVLKPKCK